MASDEVLFVLIPEWADWEPAVLSAGLRRGFGMWQPRHQVKIVAPCMEPAISIGGFRALPDYTLETAPEDFAALVLVGGSDWFGDAAVRVPPLIDRALGLGAVVGGICDASVFLGAHGYLNEVHHTSNDLSALKARAGSAYTGEAKYHADRQSVRDGSIVTANGAGFLEFAREMFLALEVAPAETVEMAYAAFKSGFYVQPK